LCEAPFGPFLQKVPDPFLNRSFQEGFRMDETLTAPMPKWTDCLPAWAWVLAAVVAVQVTVAALFPVLPEEAYHWNFGRHLDWGYYDHPPMLPWAIALGRALLGDTALGVRLVPLLFALGTSVLLARLAQRFYGDKAAAWAVLLYNLQPAGFFIGGWAFPDSPVLFFWMVTLTCVWHALDANRPLWWLAAGAALGAGMLSKYTAAFLVPSIFLYLVFSQRDRHWLLSPWPYLAGVCSLVVFAPVIYWNWAHEWVSFRMQSTGRFEAASGMAWDCGLQATSEQWIFVLPLTLPLAAVVLWRLAKLAQPRDQFLFWAFAPMAAFFFVIGWTPSWHVLWSLPAYLALTVAMAGALADVTGSVARFYRLHWRWLVGLELCGIVLIVLHGAMVLPGIKPLRETYGWDQAADLSRSLCATLPAGSFFMTAGGRTYPSTSQLAFHLARPQDVFGPNLVGQEALQYRFWADPQRLAGKDAVIVVEGDVPASFGQSMLEPYFQTVELSNKLTVPAGKFGSLSSARVHFTLFVAHGYRPTRQLASK
jgi:dolichol-phosphate mannosyltransferase